MTWDQNRVRIELCDVMTLPAKGPEATLAVRQAAEIWLSDDEGKIKRTRKPTVTIAANSRAELLHQIAHWIENNLDPSLEELAASFNARGQR